MTMLNRAHCLSSLPDLFADECDNLKAIFSKLKYPENLINSTITRFIESRNQPQVGNVQASAPVRIILLFKDQQSADVVRRQLSDLGKKIHNDLHPVFTSKRTADDIKVAEAKPTLINQRRIFYKLKCDLCDADYVGYLPTPFPTHWRTQTLSYWKTPAWRPQSEEQRAAGTIYYPSEMSRENALYPTKETWAENSIRLNQSKTI